MSLLAAIKARRVYFFVALIWVVLDQVTKILAHAYLPGRGPVVVIPDLFNLIYTRNPGGLFGYFGDLGAPWRTLLLTFLPMLAIVLVVGFLARGEMIDRKTLFGLGLILGGAVGNLIDRVFRGEVVDFLDVYASWPGISDWLLARFGTTHWPTFNVADSGIVVGACLLMLNILKPTPQADEVAASPAGRREPG